MNPMKNQEKEDKNELTPISFLRPEFLLGDLWRGKKFSKKTSNLFTPLRNYAGLIMLILAAIFLINGTENTLSWLNGQWLDILLAVIIGFFFLLFFRTKNRK